MKKIQTICLLSVMLFAQFAKQFTYLECVVSNSFANATVKCDCEKLEKQVNDEKTALPTHKNHVHINVDEIFICANHFDLQSIFSIIVQQQNDAYLAVISTGIHLQQDHPPEFSFILV